MKQLTTYAFLIALGIIISCSPKQISQTGVITFLKGNATLAKEKEKISLKVGDEVKSGDLIETGMASTVIVSFVGGESEAEIQSNSKFLIESYTEKKANLEILNGNVWFRVNQKNQKDFNLANPTAVAGVRGTKFFTFQVDKDTFGTCHCEGKVHYTIKSSHLANDNEKDYMIVVRNGKSIIIEPEEFKQMFPGRTTGHDHSEIENSSLGKAQSFTNEERKILFNKIESKFAAL
jgi:hypothetical protein